MESNILEFKKLLETARGIVDQNSTLWDGNDCADYFRVGSRHFVDRISKTFGFPKPIRLPSGGGKKGHARWYANEVRDWAAAQRKAG